MQQVFTTPRMGSVQQECHYVCPATGERITSWRQRANNFAKNNLMDANDFTPDYLRRKRKQHRDHLTKLANGLPMPEGYTHEKLAAEFIPAPPG